MVDDPLDHPRIKLPKLRPRREATLFEFLGVRPPRRDIFRLPHPFELILQSWQCSLQTIMRQRRARHCGSDLIDVDHSGWIERLLAGFGGVFVGGLGSDLDLLTTQRWHPT